MPNKTSRKKNVMASGDKEGSTRWRVMGPKDPSHICMWETFHNRWADYFINSTPQTICIHEVVYLLVTGLIFVTIPTNVKPVSAS